MIAAKAIKPGRPLQSSIFRDEMHKAAEIIRKDALDSFKKTVGNWKNKPEFTSKITIGGVAKGIKIVVSTDSPIYRYIDEGTRVRYATMSLDWKSKTIPDVMGSFPGKGRKLFVNKKRPRPGIKARHFTKYIGRTTQRELVRETNNALARFARRSGRGA